MQTYASAEQVQLSFRSPKISAHTMPQLAEYEALVNGFNVRSFTYPEDALWAFAGVATRLGSKFKGGFISGLPELFFDLALLWRPQRRAGTSRRRVAVRQKADLAVLPSWSWAGWETEITVPFTWNYSTEAAAPLPVLVEDVKPFYEIEARFCKAKTGEQVLIRNSWMSYASDALSKNGTLPAGWTGRKVRQQASSIHADYGENLTVFTHSSDQSTLFWFPVSLSNVPYIPQSPKLIILKSFKGDFKLGGRHRHTTVICAFDETPCGLLWPDDESEEAFLANARDEWPIHLVAILGCVVPKDDRLATRQTLQSTQDSPDLHLQQTSPPSRLKEVYAVLWIQVDEQSGVAYRKGSGQVERDMWEKYADQKQCNILLG
jgi:hypothetical protein